MRAVSRLASVGIGWLLLAGLARQDAGGAKPAGPILVLHSGGLDALLPDPRDAGLRRALGMLGERLIELAREHGAPAGLAELVFDLSSLPFDLQVDAVEPADVPPIRAQLAFHAAAPEIEALAQRLDTVLAALLPVQATSAADLPGMKSLALPAGELVYGARADSLVIALGRPAPPGPVQDFGLPAGIAPALALRLDLGALLRPLEAVLAARGAEAAPLHAVLAQLGLLDGAPLGFTFALGQGADRMHLAARVRGGGRLARPSGASALPPLGTAELRLVPRDALEASLTKVDLEATLTTMESIWRLSGQDPLAPLSTALGLDLRTDVLEPLGTTVGFYLSDTTGGGGLASAVAFATVDDEAKLARSLDAIAGAVERLGAGTDATVRLGGFEHAGARCRSLAFAGLPVPFEPSLALAKGVLFVGATPQALVAALQHAGGSDPGLLAHPGFRAASVGSLADLQALRFTDTPRLLAGGYGWMTLLCSALANGVRSADGAREPGLVLPPYPELAAGARPFVLVSRLEGDDLVNVGQGDRSALANLTALVGGVAPLAGIVFTGMLASLVVPNVVTSLSQAKATKARADVIALAQAVNEYAVDNGGRFPESLDALVTPDQRGYRYLNALEVPHDPWGNEYVYEPPAPGTLRFRIVSFGADGVPGGAGDDADIDNLDDR